MLGFCLAIRQALRLGEPLRALGFSRIGILLPSRGRADPGTLGFCLAIRQALRLDEPLHALGYFFSFKRKKFLDVLLMAGFGLHEIVWT